MGKNRGTIGANQIVNHNESSSTTCIVVSAQMKISSAKFTSGSETVGERRRRSCRAIGLGAGAIVGGSLAVTTVIGTATITGMLLAGNSPESIISTLTGSFALAFFCAVGGLLMSIIGGYSAATIAGRLPIGHAFWAGALALSLNLILFSICGDSGPAWLTVLANLLVIPSAAIGGRLAAPIPTTVPAPVPKF